MLPTQHGNQQLCGEQTALPNAGQFSLAPLTRKWLHSDWATCRLRNRPPHSFLHPKLMTHGASIEAAVKPTSHPNAHQFQELCNLGDAEGVTAANFEVSDWGDQGTQQLLRQLASYWKPVALLHGAGYQTSGGSSSLTCVYDRPDEQQLPEFSKHTFQSLLRGATTSYSSKQTVFGNVWGIMLRHYDERATHDQERGRPPPPAASTRTG